ncbi:MAG: CoA-binding protein [Thermodesulfobacteriota bacterium]
MRILSEMRSFFHPRGVAVVGVSRDEWKFGSVMFIALQKFGSSTPLYPVSHRITEFMGRKVFPSISALPEEADLAIVCLPAPFVAETVRECSRKGFFEVVRSMAATKPTVLWKAGLTPGGARAAASHTGSLAGSDTAWTAFFKQTGAIQVFSMEELLDTVSVFYHLPATGDSRVALVAGGGGIGVSGSDACHRAGLRFPSFDEKTREKLTSLLPRTGANRRNPVDCDTPFPRPSALRNVLETIAESGEVGSIVIDKVAMSLGMRRIVGYDKQTGGEDEPDQPWLEELPVQIRERYRMPVIVVQREGGEPLDRLACVAERRRLRKYYEDHGVAVFPTAQRAMNALGRMTRYYQRSRNWT